MVPERRHIDPRATATACLRAGYLAAILLLGLLGLLVLSPHTACRAQNAVDPLLDAKPLNAPQTVPNSGIPAPDTVPVTRFERMSPASTGVTCVTRVDWEHPRGLMFYMGYACGGMAVGDVNGDGLPDLVVAGGPQPTRLYLQTAPWKFDDATRRAGLDRGAAWGWSTGATLLDIDNDGDLDLYVCYHAAANELYINRGDGTFDEQASRYGLDLIDASLIASPCDYDCDGDVDLYLAANRWMEERDFSGASLFYWREGEQRLRPQYAKWFDLRSHPERSNQLNLWIGRRDYLLRNEGPGRPFADVSRSLGLDRGDTLSATWWDADHDGLPDLYVANDLSSPDRLFMNRGRGRLVDATRARLPHTPWFAMGSCAGDVNNDARIDLLVADMSFRTHFKDKSTMGDMTTKFAHRDYFPGDQQMRNALYLNTGTARFQEAAALAGLAATDWTWSVGLADLDNDGRLDALFTNGTPVDPAVPEGGSSIADNTPRLDMSQLRLGHRGRPGLPEQNLVFQNLGDLQFVDRSAAWGLDHVGMSYAAAQVDLDRDGDLDLIVNNLNEPPSLYQNRSQATGALVALHGRASNRWGVGAEVRLQTAMGIQVRQLYPVAGFQTCQEPVLHFGLGEAQRIDVLTVRWPSGAVQQFRDLPVNHLLTIEEPTGSIDRAGAAPLRDATSLASRRPVFSEFRSPGLNVRHHEEPFDDFARQPLLPNRLSREGPAMAWGDLNHDGLQDLYLGEGRAWPAMVYLQESPGHWQPTSQPALAEDSAGEDIDAVFFDVDDDGDLDLYVARGSVEYPDQAEALADRLYLNDGRANFTTATRESLPEVFRNSSTVAVCDFDHDQDLDLFLGGRSIPGQYPLDPSHALLRNDAGKLVDVLATVAPQLAGAGMVTDATWADLDGDGWEDLVLATDWGPLRVFWNRRGRLDASLPAANLDQYTGWWRSVVAADVDRDGDLDLVAGNQGHNTKYRASPDSPLRIYYGDYAGDGSRHLIEAGFEAGQLYPLRGRSCSSDAMPHLKQRFPSYQAFARATLPEIYTEACLAQSKVWEVTTLASGVFLNEGGGKFAFRALPYLAQLAPVSDIATCDANGDGHPDLVLAQNFFGPQRETGEHDGGLSVLALGRGDGTFDCLRPDVSGLVVAEDARRVAVVDLNGDQTEDVCLATNNGPLRAFTLGESRKPTAGIARLKAAGEAAHPFHPTDPPRVSAAESTLLEAQRLLDASAGAGLTEQTATAMRLLIKQYETLVEGWLLEAGLYRVQGRLADAERVVDELQPTNSEAIDQLELERGRLALARERWRAACGHFARAESEASRPYVAAEGALGLGRALVRRGRLAEAARALERARHLGAREAASEITALERRQVTARVLAAEGARSEESGELTAARTCYEKSLVADSQQPATLRRLANLLGRVDSPQTADPWLAEDLRRRADAIQRAASQPR